MPSHNPARRAVSSPPLPASFLAIQIVQATARPNVTVQELGAMCQHDPGFVMRALAYVNSAGLALSRKVTSVQHAVSLLGIRGTRNLALGMCVMELTPSASESSCLLEVCLRRAVIARLLSEKLALKNPEDYFTMGLLLEIGLLVKARTDLASATHLAGAAANTRITLERAAGQEDHAKLGARLARSWQLGEELSKALLLHHDRAPAQSKLGEIAWLSELLAGVFENGDASKSRAQAIEAAASLGISAQIVDEALEQTPAGVTDAARQLGKQVAPQASIDSLLHDTTESLGELNRNYSEVVDKLEALLKEKEQLADALRRADQKLSSMALTDDVSGLPNGRAFREALSRDLARADRSKTHIALVVLELDHFQRLLDKAGPSAADAALGATAEVLLSCVRTSDVLARVGPATFAMLLPSTNLQGALVVAERIRTRMNDKAFDTNVGTLTVTPSIGVAATMGPNCRDQAEPLLAAAENGLAMARNAGRNRVMVGSL